MSATAKPRYLEGCHLIIELWTPEGKFVKVLSEGTFPDYRGAVLKYVFKCCEYKNQEPDMHVQARLYELKEPSTSPRAIQAIRRRLLKLQIGLPVDPLPSPTFMYLTFDADHADCPRVLWTQSKRGVLRRLGGKKGYVLPFQHS